MNAALVILVSLLVAGGAGVVALLVWWRARWVTAMAEMAGLRVLADRHEARSADLHELFAGLLEAIPYPVFVTDTHRVVVAANRGALDLVDLTPEQVIGRAAGAVVQDYDTIHGLLEAARTGRTQDITFQRPADDATWARRGHPRAQGVGGANAPIARLIMTIEDLTGLRGLETIRRDFVAHVSHELRTPLAATSLLAETLRRAVTEDPEAVRASRRGSRSGWITSHNWSRSCWSSRASSQARFNWSASPPTSPASPRWCWSAWRPWPRAAGSPSTPRWPPTCPTPTPTVAGSPRC